MPVVNVRNTTLNDDKNRKFRYTEEDVKRIMIEEREEIIRGMLDFLFDIDNVIVNRLLLDEYDMVPFDALSEDEQERILDDGIDPDDGFDNDDDESDALEIFETKSDVFITKGK